MLLQQNLDNFIVATKIVGALLIMANRKNVDKGNKWNYQALS